jgi:sulfatase modifying factor 1
MTRPVAIAIGIVASAAAATLGIAWQAGNTGRDGGGWTHCGTGYTPRAGRCAVASETACPRPLVTSALGCDAPDERVAIPDATLSLGASDWEAEGRVRSRTIRVEAFRMDAFEVTRGSFWGGAFWGVQKTSGSLGGDAARAASGMTRDRAATFCAARGGRLPTEDEWIVAATSGADVPRRYPWGDTGAVCRRAAWGLRDGPCARLADGPDTVGAHPDGDSPLGIHDLAGNVAEWVAADMVHPGLGVAKGGSWQSDLASDLRIWARLELDPDSHDARVGFRCAY